MAAARMAVHFNFGVSFAGSLRFFGQWNRLLFVWVLLAVQVKARAQLVDGVYKTRRHVAFEGELFRFSGHQFVYLKWTDVGSFSGRGTYQLAADTLRLYFRNPARLRYGLIDSGSVQQYQIAKIRKGRFILQSLQPYSLGYREKYHRQKGQHYLEAKE